VPCTDVGNRLVHSAAQFCLNCLQLGNHAFLRRFLPDDERPIAPALPAVVRKSRNLKFSGFPSPGFSQSWAANCPNSISHDFSGCSSCSISERSRNDEDQKRDVVVPMAAAERGHSVENSYLQFSSGGRAVLLEKAEQPRLPKLLALGIVRFRYPIGE